MAGMRHHSYERAPANQARACEFVCVCVFLPGKKGEKRKAEFCLTQVNRCMMEKNESQKLMIENAALWSSIQPWLVSLCCVTSLYKVCQID